MSLDKFLEDVASMMSMNTHLNGVLDFRGIFDLGFLCIVEIWYYVKNRLGSTLSWMYCQTYSVSPPSSDLVDLCLNIWWNNTKETFFLGICFCDFEFSFIFTKNACFLCALYDIVTEFFSLSLKKTMQSLLWRRQVCPKFINATMENNWSHKSGANTTLYHLAMKGFPLLSIISIWTCPACFAVMKWSSKTSIYLFVSTNEPGKNPKSLVSCGKLHLSQKYDWPVASCLHSLFKTLHIGRHTCHRHLYILWLAFVCTGFPMYYIFSLICTHTFQGFPRFSELSYPNFLVLDNLHWNSPPIHTQSTYLVSDRYVYYTYYLSSVDREVVSYSLSPFVAA